MLKSAKKVRAGKPAAVKPVGLQFEKGSCRKVKAGFKFSGTLPNGYKVEALGETKESATAAAEATLATINSYLEHTKAVAREKRLAANLAFQKKV